jgi:HEAT repeat protein
MTQSKIKSGFVVGTLKQVEELKELLKFESADTKLEAIQVLLKTAYATIEDIQLQFQVVARAKERTNYKTQANDMRKTIDSVKKLTT